ncbi:MAG: RNA-binding protein [Rhodospirillaceae bacterium]|nr:RNA-binding protein [Rhodospirillaceae bacterium]
MTEIPELPDCDDDGPHRRCLILGESQSTDLLLRFVLGPEDQVVPDIDERLPGRGFWLSARRDVVETAVKRKAFHRVARRMVNVPDDLVGLVERLLLRRCQDSLGLARRSGRALCGFDKVAAALSDGPGSLIEASDGSADGGRKIGQHVRRAGAAPRRIAAALTAEELGISFARERAVHAWVSAGPLADRIARDMARLASYRGI